MADAEKEMKDFGEKARGRQPFIHDGRTVYEWEQTLSDVHVFLKPPPNAAARDLDIKVQPHRLRVGLKGKPPLFDEETWSTVNASDSFWMIEDGEIHIQMCKMRKAEVWDSALKGHGALDPFCQQETKKKLMLERFQEENPGFDFSGATFSGDAPDPRSFMGGVSSD